MLYDIIVSLIVASSSGGVFVCGNSANWPGTSTNAGKKPASCQLESGQCHKAGCFFFCRRFFPGWESQICQLAQQFRPIQYMHPMLRNATNHQPYASVKFSRNKSSTFSYIFKISVAKRQILWGALVWHPQPASRHVASAPVAWGARSRSKCLAVGWYRLGRPMSTQCFGKCKTKRRNGEHIHKNKIK